MRGFDFGWGDVGKMFVVDVHFCNISDVSEGVGLCLALTRIFRRFLCLSVMKMGLFMYFLTIIVVF